ncbi:hypothetical protein QMTAC487_21360 [Sphaerotilus sp. FB-3]|nr:hypothetical protein QMTAC487_21360 [Sphaerotilus sp. FB-3]
MTCSVIRGVDACVAGDAAGVAAAEAGSRQITARRAIRRAERSGMDVRAERMREGIGEKEGCINVNACNIICELIHKHARHKP